jgi:flagellar motor switch protein FliM
VAQLTEHSSLLAQIATQVNAPVTVVPLSSVRAVRQAVTRAADNAFGMSVAVYDMVLSTTKSAGVIAGISETDCRLRLERGGALVGILAIDPQLRGAVIEMQTIGPLPKRSPPNANTRVRM